MFFRSDIVGAYLHWKRLASTAISNITLNMTWADFTADQSIAYGPVTGYASFFGTDNPFVFPYYA